MSAENPGGRSVRPDETVDEPPTGSASAIFTAPRVTGSSSRPESRTPGPSSHNDPADEGWVGDRYKLVRLLGRGGHGRVYEAIHTHLDRHYALKVLGPPDEARGTKGRFEREAKLLSLLNHENIVGVIDAGVDPVRGQYLVLELVNGRTLADYIDKQMSINTPLLISLIEQLAKGLHHAHQQKIVHRDLKPENIMLSPLPSGGYIVKILDFGIAKLTEPGPEAITRSGWSLGTAAYMAPEQARGGRDLDERVDVFAFGVVTYEVLAGKRPFDGSSYNETLFKVVSQPHESILVHRPDLSKEVASVLDRALCKEREGRYSSVAEFADRLTTALRRSPDSINLPGRRTLGGNNENALLSTDVAPVSDLQAAYQPPPIKRWKLLSAVASVAAAAAIWGFGTSDSQTTGPEATATVSPSAGVVAANSGATAAPGAAVSQSGVARADVAAPQTSGASNGQTSQAVKNDRVTEGAAGEPADAQQGGAQSAGRGRTGKSRSGRRKEPSSSAQVATPAQPPKPHVTPEPAPKPTPAPKPSPARGYVLDSPY
jgi:serine/threonine protein kinase